MDLKHLVAAAAIAASTLTFGSALAYAVPLDPPPQDPNRGRTHAPTQGDEVLAVRSRRTWKRTRRWWGAGVPTALSAGHPALTPRAPSR